MNDEKLAALGAFEETAMSYEEAQQKVKLESRVKTNYFRLDKDGEYTFRVLPLAPVQVDGKWVLDRKGYEYPLTSYMIGFPGETRGKFNYVSIIDPRQVFPNVDGDLFRTYYDLAVAELGDDKKAIESLGNVVSKGGAAITPSYLHCIYVIDQDEPNKGIQMLQLSNSQYQALETLKMSTWRDLLKDDPKTRCPLSDFREGYNVIATKDKSKKPPITFNLSRRAAPVDSSVAQELLDMERIPNVIYRYTRYHLEATVEYLKMLDERYDFDFMSEGDGGEFANDKINTVYQQIKMSLPSDDHSHFNKNNINGSDGDNTETDQITLDTLKELVEKCNDLEPTSDEYAAAKTTFENFIKANELNYTPRRYHNLADMLEAIEDELGESNGNKDDSDSDGQAKADIDATDRNDDTNEPAARPARTRRQ